MAGIILILCSAAATVGMWLRMARLANLTAPEVPGAAQDDVDALKAASRLAYFVALGFFAIGLAVAYSFLSAADTSTIVRNAAYYFGAWLLADLFIELKLRRVRAQCHERAKRRVASGGKAKPAAPASTPIRAATNNEIDVSWQWLAAVLTLSLVAVVVALVHFHSSSSRAGSTDYTLIGGSPSSLKDLVSKEAGRGLVIYMAHDLDAVDQDRVKHVDDYCTRDAYAAARIIPIVMVEEASPEAVNDFYQQIGRPARLAISAGQSTADAMRCSYAYVPGSGDPQMWIASSDDMWVQHLTARDATDGATLDSVADYSFRAARHQQ
jgi:hypothetical protein